MTELVMEGIQLLSGKVFLTLQMWWIHTLLILSMWLRLMTLMLRVAWYIILGLCGFLLLVGSATTWIAGSPPEVTLALAVFGIAVLAVTFESAWNYADRLLPE